MKPLTSRPNFRPLFLLACGLLVACSKPEAPAEPTRAVRTLVVGVGPLQSHSDFAAEVRARMESRLSFRVGGKVANRTVNLGDVVRAGQVLAQLDPQDLRLGQEAAKAAVAAAQTQWEQAEADLKRYRELREQGFIGAAELERRDTAAKAARAQWEQAKAQAGVQGNQAAYASLTAERAGVVTGVDVEPGQVVAAGSPVVRVAYDGPRDAVFSIPEDRYVTFKALIGQPGALRAQVWGTQESMPATLRELSAAADPQTRTFQAKADLGAAGVRLGQTVTVTLPRPSGMAGIRLPLMAVAELKGQTSVWMVDAAGDQFKVRQQPITVASADGNEVLVASGLKVGDRVVSAGVHVLTPGQVVRLYKEPAVAPAPASAASR